MHKPKRECMAAGLSRLLLTAGLFALVPVMPSGAKDVDCSDAATQTDMNICSQRDYEAADKALNVAYRKAMAMMRRRDATEKRDQRGAVEALVRAERGWIDYRDGECTAEGFSARGGTLEPLLVSSCKARLTRIHTRELLDLAKQY